MSFIDFIITHILLSLYTEFLKFYHTIPHGSIYIHLLEFYLLVIFLLQRKQGGNCELLATMMLLNCGAGEDFCESLGLQGDQASQS